MKRETKELIKWAISLIEDYRVQNMVEHSNFRKNTPAAQNSAIEIKNCKDFTEFLNSLPEIESHLYRGGYIQDKNGTPCCDRDKISFRINKCNPIYFNNHLLLNESILTGYLRWIDFKGGFSIVYTEEKKYTSKTILLTLIDISEFEKVEND